MPAGEIEIYKPRAVTHLGVWDVGHLQLKVYGLMAEGRKLTTTITDDARLFLNHALPPLVAAEGQDNGLGFVIIHPGELGISILAHWWIQGSVLCQHIRRTLWGATEPMNTTSRPVIACVWELGLINAEQQFWRETMMGRHPNPDAYLLARPAADVV